MHQIRVEVPIVPPISAACFYTTVVVVVVVVVGYKTIALCLRFVVGWKALKSTSGRSVYA